MIVSYIQKTCHACPAQWEGALYDGRMFYIRYRWGILRLCVSNEPVKNIEDIIINDDNFVYEIEHTGNSHNDGFMEDEEMMELLKHLLDFSFIEKDNPNSLLRALKYAGNLAIAAENVLNSDPFTLSKKLEMLRYSLDEYNYEIMKMSNYE